MNTSVWIINLAVLIAVLEADLGHRRITWFRVARPLVLSAVIVPIYLKHTVTSGHGLALEVVGAVAGVLFGVAAASVMTVRRDAATGRAVSDAGVLYAALWIVVIAARLFFVYGSNHIFQNQLGHWMMTEHITKNALTDALVFMAVTMTLSRTAALVGRAAAAKPASELEAAEASAAATSAFAR